MAVILPRRQKEILEFVYQFIQKHRYAPTLTEIGQAFGLQSAATIHEHVANLERKGFIRRYDGVVRGLEILDEAKAILTAPEVEIPLLGYIAAGAPLAPYPQNDVTLTLASSWISGKKPTFALQVKGSSMIEDGILDGDYVICEREENPRDGEIVVALLDDGFATLKRFYRETDQVRLEPANAKMAPIYAKNVRVQGKVVAVIRRYQ